ncbi:MAG TPA: hypothetical protein VGA55_03600 [Bacteroidota bacterium]
MTRIALPAILALLVLNGCPPFSLMRPVEPDHIFYLDDGDSLSCKLVRGEILVTRVVSAAGDSLALENAAIDRIVHLKTGRDVTDRYIDRDALKVELAKEAALAKRAKLEADVAAGKRKKSELNRLPFAVLTAELERPDRGIPQIALTILNLTDKKISLVKTRIYCYDSKGKPQEGTKGRDHVFDATSRVPIGPGEDFTTLLALRNHPKTRKAKVDIHYLEFADKTWWKGKVEEQVN